MGFLPDMIVPHSYGATSLEIAAESLGCFTVSDEVETAFWVPDPVPAIYAAALDLNGCLDADHTK